jgi:hypothetical protein
MIWDMTTALGRDRLRGLVDVLIESIDDWATGPHLAKQACLSRPIAWERGR